MNKCDDALFPGLALGSVAKVTTAETKAGVLLIEQFKTLINHKLWSPGIISWWPFSYRSELKGILNFGKSEHRQTM
jgi:hypothetical protein